MGGTLVSMTGGHQRQKDGSNLRISATYGKRVMDSNREELEKAQSEQLTRYRFCHRREKFLTTLETNGMLLLPLPLVISRQFCTDGGIA